MRFKCLIRILYFLFALFIIGANTITVWAQSINQAQAVETLRSLNSGNVSIQQNVRSGFINFLSTNPTDPILFGSNNMSVEERAREFLQANKNAFISKIVNLELVTVNINEKDEVNIDHVRFQQLLKGIPIRGAEVSVHLKSAGITAVNSKLFTDFIELNTIPSLSSQTATDIARFFITKTYGQIPAKFSTPKLEIYNRALLGGSSNELRLSWFIEATDTLMREFVWIDAQQGELLLHINQLMDARNRLTHDAQSTNSLPGLLRRSEGSVAVGIVDLDNAHDFAGNMYDYFFLQHNRDSFDGNGAAIVSTVRFCPTPVDCPYQNAFWNGVQIVFGQGFAVDDVVAHELTHAVIERSANLIYLNQSGALNESYADIFAESIDLGNGRGNDLPQVRWLMGEEIPGIGAIRNMQNPAQFGDPAKVTDPRFFCGTLDNGGVHINSGVPNRAYTLMVDGGNFNGYTIAGIGLVKAGKVQYRALANYLTTTSNLLDNFNALSQSCADLIGISGITVNDCAQVKNALLAVEMNITPCVNASPLPPPLPDPGPLPDAVAFCPTGLVPNNLFIDDLENSASGNWANKIIVGVNHWNGGVGLPAIYKTINPNSGIYSFVGNGLNISADSVVEMTTDISLPINTHMQFKHDIRFEPGFDGGVIEYSTDKGGTWLDAGRLISFGQNYTSFLLSGTQNPLANRFAFSGDSAGFVTTQLNLNEFVNNTIRFRFRVGTDTTVGSVGWSVDDITIYECINNDIAGFIVEPTTGLTTTEIGGTDTFTVVLTSQPTAIVNLPVFSEDISEGAVSLSNLTFSPNNWNSPQTVTVQGVDDTIIDPDIIYVIKVGPSSSTDSNYNLLAGANVTVVNMNNDIGNPLPPDPNTNGTPGITLGAVTELMTTENGGTVEFTIVLNSLPSSNVIINLTSSNIAEGQLNTSTIVFTPQNWQIPQSVFVTGIDDRERDGDIAFVIGIQSQAVSDPSYAALSPININLVNIDNESFTVQKAKIGNGLFDIWSLFGLLFFVFLRKYLRVPAFS